MLDKILIPINESAIVQRLIKKLPSRLEIPQKEIYFVYISKPYPPSSYSEVAYNDYSISIGHHRAACKGHAQNLFNKYHKLLEPAKKIELIHDFDDDISSGIIQAAKKKKVDVIIMTTHRYTGLKSIFLGDRVHDVIVNSKFPVLVV